MNISSLYQIYLQHPVVTTDSRTVSEGSLFFALKGDNFDGNQFALQTLAKGAAYAICDNQQVAGQDPRIIIVDNVLTTLQQLASYHRDTLGIPVLAITGTNGKTTTKELIATVLASKFRITATKGNLNNHIGVPLTLLSIGRETELAVVEMGANHPGDIDELCAIAHPDLGIITNVGKAHLEGFGSFEGVINTKTELYRYLQSKNGTIFCNSSNPWLSPLTGSTPTEWYTSKKGFQGVEGEIVSSDPLLTARVLFPKGWLYIRTRLIGSYNLENVVAAATIGLHFGIDPVAIVAALESYRPENNRSQLHPTATNRLILDAYNANPTSMQAAIENFRYLKAGKKGVILGDMLELGDASAGEHQKIVDLLAGEQIDRVILVGKQFMETTAPSGFSLFASAEALKEELRQNPIHDYTLLIKGSRGIRLEQVVELL